MSPPDLNDPAQRAAYRQELRGVARGLRLSGLWTAVAGLLLIATWRSGVGVPLWLAASVAGLGAMLMISGMAARTRYHALRMRG